MEVDDDSGKGGVGGGELDKVSKSSLREMMRKKERKVLEYIEFKNSYIVGIDIESQATSCACFNVR